MFKFNLAGAARVFVSLLVLTLAALPICAQPNSSGGSTAPANTTQQTTTTTQTTQPTTQVTRTVERTTGVDPLWLVLGGIVLLAIIAIAFLSMRGRSRDSVAVVHERQTTVRKE